jgi:hypothetical protein
MNAWSPSALNTLLKLGSLQSAYNIIALLQVNAKGHSSGIEATEINSRFDCT